MFFILRNIYMLVAIYSIITSSSQWFGQKKGSLVSGNWPGESCLPLNRPHSRICTRIYIFNFKKQQRNQQQKQESKKAKETKQEKRIYLENWLKK